MTTTPPTPDAAGPVEAVLAVADGHQRSHHTVEGGWWQIACLCGWEGTDSHLNPSQFLAHRREAFATALAPLFAAHGAAERRAGAVSALDGVERRLCDEWPRNLPMLRGRVRWTIRELRGADDGCACGHGAELHDAEANPPMCMVCGDNTHCTSSTTPSLAT